MKNFLQNLLIFLALCLCALIAFQWVRETDLRKQIQKLTDTVHDKSQDILNLQATVRHQQSDIQNLTSIRDQFAAIIKTNEADIARMTKELDKADRENRRLSVELENYKVAFTNEYEQVKRGNAEIKELGESIKTLAFERSLAVSNLNNMGKVISDVALKWSRMGEDIQKATPAVQREMAVTNLIVMAGDFNEFVAKWNSMQKDLQRAQTNGAPKN